eukprot:Plantae.Rhodophyta-Purpureofilum_apyrenoidigerum.ctg7021.p1 GENE.Plantae.Rhodophyta-Purpureofilum_apyrenoidigerum.ctg7021~~Plantae.Rhodophyta-Purpureofilum_apyrenoidigerum.ctg7021.p1  ORF type:complete len:296 (-),score=38.17 Plantae.Rhodophyta-Purpureofilum_apyrenoidigerum.ctg7021:100-987(-)
MDLRNSGARGLCFTAQSRIGPTVRQRIAVVCVRSPTTQTGPERFGKSRRDVLITLSTMLASVANSMANASKVWAMSGEPTERQPVDNAGVYKPKFAEAMEYGMALYEDEVASRKRTLFQRKMKPGDKILELGIGTGPNLKFYPADVEVYGLEPNRAMHPYAAAKAPPSMKLTLSTASAENINYENSSFDVVVCTLTLCSVQKPLVVLQEVHRVLKPGGHFLFLEHVVGRKFSPLFLLQNLVNPLQIALADNCHLTRDTERLIRSVFHDVQVEHFRMAAADAYLISPTISGFAQTN